MGMQERDDGTLGAVKEVKDLAEAFKQTNEPGISKLHIANTMEELEIRKKQLEGNPVEEEPTYKRSVVMASAQFDRIETMLTAIMLHFNVPYKGILQMHKDKHESV